MLQFQVVNKVGIQINKIPMIKATHAHHFDECNFHQIYTYKHYSTPIPI